MGQVWLAQDTALDQLRALKFVLPTLLTDATARKRLRNEARLGTELAHPRIVRVFDFVEESGGNPLAAVVMEFIEGRTLSDLLADQEIGFFEPEAIERWVQDVTEGLRYAHEEKRRFHLDLKPGNIIVETASGRAKLLDFGISRSAKDSVTRLTGQVSSGTLPYMSPQQLDGEPPCAADDVYGLGATVYELLTGTPPFFRGKIDDQIRTKVPESIMDRRRQNTKEGLNSGVGNVVGVSWEDRAGNMLGKDAAQRSLPDRTIVNCGHSSPNNLAALPVIRRVAPSSSTHPSAPAAKSPQMATFTVWVFISLVCYLAICFFGFCLLGFGREIDIRIRESIVGTLVLCLPSFIFLYLPIYGWGKKLGTAPWSKVVTSLVFAAWGCAPIFLGIFATALIYGLPATELWYNRDSYGSAVVLASSTWTMLLTSVLASALVGLFWHKALQGTWSVQLKQAENDRHRRVTTAFLIAAFSVFSSFVLYFYFL
jgi:serine/threonine protein kinase